MSAKKIKMKFLDRNRNILKRKLIDYESDSADDTEFKKELKLNKLKKEDDSKLSTSKSLDFKNDEDKSLKPVDSVNKRDKDSSKKDLLSNDKEDDLDKQFKKEKQVDIIL